MIQLVYTGAPKQGKPQLEPAYSLGGFYSSSEVANDFFSNLFGEVTINTIKNGSNDHICIALVPSLSIENIMFSIITTKNNIGRFRIAAIKIQENDCSEYVLPKIQNQYSKPVNLCFYDCTSFFGESRIRFSVIPQEGELIEVFSNGELIGEIKYDVQFQDVYIYPTWANQFSFETRFNSIDESIDLFLMQKNLFNFDPAIEVIRESNSQEIGLIENQLPVVTNAVLGDLLQNEVMGLYIERSLSKEFLRNNRKLNCEELFKAYKGEYTPSTTEIVELEIEYDESQEPVQP